jgi:hypothetical protein
MLKNKIQSHCKEDLQIRPYLQELIGEAEFLENRKYFAVKRSKLEDQKRSRSTSSLKRRDEEHQVFEKMKLKAEGFFFDKISSSCTMSDGQGRPSNQTNAYPRYSGYRNDVDIKNGVTFGIDPAKNEYHHPDEFMRTHYNQMGGAEGYGRKELYKDQRHQRDERNGYQRRENNYNAESEQGQRPMRGGNGHY